MYLSLEDPPVNEYMVTPGADPVPHAQTEPYKSHPAQTEYNTAAAAGTESRTA